MSPIFLYLVRNFTDRPFVRTLVVTTMLVVAATFSGIGSIVYNMRSAFSFPGHANRVMVLARGSRAEKDSRIDPPSFNAITVAPEIQARSPEALRLNRVTVGDTFYIVQLRGLEPAGFKMHSMKLLSGRMPTPGAAECLIGDALLEQVPSFKEGSQLSLIGVNFTVVGVFHAEGFMSGEAWTTREFYTSDPRRESLASVYLETATPEVARSLAERLSANRALEVQAEPESDYFKRAAGSFDNVVYGLAVVLFLVSAGSILASASLIALLQQRAVADLCVLRAMGFRSLRVIFLILFETELLTMAGGALGLLLTGFALRQYVVYTLGQTLTPLIFRAPLTPVVAGATVLGMFFIGIIGAALPIIRMYRLDIAQGLREE